MKLVVKKTEIIDFHPYSVVINDVKYSLKNHFNHSLEKDKEYIVYVQTYWFKTNKIVLTNINNDITLTIDFVVKSKIWFFTVFFMFSLIVLCFVYDNFILHKVTLGLSITCILFQLYLYTFGRNKYIKLRVENSPN